MAEPNDGAGTTGRASRTGDGVGHEPVVAIATYSTYVEAERAVDYLSDRRFPVQHTAIAGRGLSSFENVTGRLTSLGAAGRSALSGAVLGALFGWLFGLLDWINPLIASVLLALYGAVFGAVLGAVIGLIGHLMTGGRRDFSSESTLRADHYEVLVNTEIAEQARLLLNEAEGQGGGARSS